MGREVEADVGGAGYLKRPEVLSDAAGSGLCGLNILRGSTVGLSASTGLLIKSSSSGTSRDLVAMLGG